MKGAVKKVHRLKRVIAWLLTAAIVSGNISQLTVTTAYASETAERRNETSSNAGKASPSEATPSEAARIIDVQVTQSAIEKVLKKDFDRRPELREDLIPFEGDQKDLIIGKLYEELEGKTLVLQKKVGKAMYLVVVSDSLDGELFFEADKSERIKQESILKNIQIIGVNGYKDRDCEFRLRIIGDDLMITDAQMEEFAVIGEGSKTSAQPSSKGKQSGNSESSESAGTKETAAVTEEETKAQETTAEEPKTQETEAQESRETEETQIQTEDVKESEAEEHSREAVEKSEDTVKDGDSNSERSEEDFSVSSLDINGISVSRHEVPVLFSTVNTRATASEADTNVSGQEEADLVSVGYTKILSEEERAALMGTDVATLNGEEKKINLFSFLSQPSFGMVVHSYGMTLLSTEVDSEGKLSPYETALTYYGPDAVDKKEAVEVNLSQSKTGTIKAGILYTYTVTYTMQAAPLYEYAAGGKLSLFDSYENAKILFTVPDGITIEEQPGKIKLISSDGEGKVYEISVGDDQNVIRPGKSDSITMNAFIDGNGKRAVGEDFTLPQDSVAFYADVKVADKTDKEHVTYPGNIETITYAEQPSDTTLTLVSDDAWHIKKSVSPSANSYTVVRDNKGNPEFVDITYLIEVGMYGSSGDISRQPNGTIYQTYGRTGFKENSYKITDSLKILTEHAPEAMKPISVTAKWGDGNDVHVINNEDGRLPLINLKPRDKMGRTTFMYQTRHLPTAPIW